MGVSGKMTSRRVVDADTSEYRWEKPSGDRSVTVTRRKTGWPFALICVGVSRDPAVLYRLAATCAAATVVP